MSKNVGQLNVKLTADKKPLEQSVDSAVDKLHEAQDELQKTDASSLDTLKQTIGSVFSSLKGLVLPFFIFIKKVFIFCAF